MRLPRTLTPIVFILFLLVWPALVHADFQAGKDAYDQGNYATAFKEMRPLAEQGVAAAQFNLGIMYEKGQGVLQDYAQAREWYLKAAEQGHAAAQVNMGVMYGKGLGVPQDDGEAVRWYRLAAVQGHATAQFNLGILYGKGQGVLQDYVQAHMWASLAAAQNQELATKLRAALAEQMTHEQIAEAQRLAREWMAQHQADFRAGLDAYNQGDYATALKEWQPLAEQGDAAAQFNLGGMYSLGQGVPQDDQEAVRWWRLAAEQGDAAAQFNLGVSYDQGRGVPQDDGEAVRWYRLAAVQGHATAQFNLGILYDKGQGVSQDYIQAHMWVNLASAQGHVVAPKARDSIAKKMTPEQIAEAQRLAREWMAQHQK